MTQKLSTAYGYDPASPEGDYSALVIKTADNKFFNFVGDEADAILALIKEETDKAKKSLLEEIELFVMQEASMYMNSKFTVRQSDKDVNKTKENTDVQ